MKSRKLTQFLCLIFFTTFAHIASAGLIFTATLGGDQEVPANPSTATGSAVAELTGVAGSYVLTYTINYAGLGWPLLAGHFHNAPSGVNGGAVHFLDNLLLVPGTIVGDWRYDDGSFALSDALANQLIQGNIYINLHTQNFPGGEIRGQLTLVPEPASLALLGLGLMALSLRRFKKHS